MSGRAEGPGGMGGPGCGKRDCGSSFRGQSVGEQWWNEVTQAKKLRNKKLGRRQTKDQEIKLRKQRTRTTWGKSPMPTSYFRYVMW